MQPATRSDDPIEEADSLCAEFSRANAAELSQMYESLQRRERLLAASANASRLLLEAPDVMAAVPHVLRQLGEAAELCLHDLAVVDRLADDVAVLRNGVLQEMGPRDQILRNPQTEYTQRLVAAVPVPDPEEQRRRREASAGLFD